MPCEECIVLAICITKQVICCQKLYSYLVTIRKNGDGWSSTDIDLTGMRWNHKNVDIMQKRFGKELFRLSQIDYSIHLKARPS